MNYLIIRLLCSFFTGVILSQSGSLVQLGTRNILSSPSTLGMDGLAVLWVLILHSFSVWMGFESEWFYLVGIACSVVIGFSMMNLLKDDQKFERIILMGITFNLVVGAIFSLWQFLFLAFNLPFPVELWFGHFRFANETALIKILLAEALMVAGLFTFRRELGLFTLGWSTSRHFNLSKKSLFTFIFVSVSIATYVVISNFGAFSFLGLVFPIVARKFWFRSYDLKGELFIGGLMNGIVFMLIDYFCYEFTFFGAEVPVGLIATAVGAVSLICILWNRSDREILAKPKK